MQLLAVDLAAKYSAACLMDENYQVIDQFDSWQQTEEQFIYLLAGKWFQGPLVDDGHFVDGPPPPAVMAVEDLPHGLNYSRLVKTVLRLQGRIVQAMHEMPEGRTGDVVFLAPNAWRKHYDLKRGTGPDIVVPTAAGFGYTAPDVSARAQGVKGGKAIARKVATDYCAAYLIARFMVDMHKQHNTFDVVGTSRYGTEVIRKKDVNDQDS